MKNVIFVCIVMLGLGVSPAFALVFDNGVKYRWGDPFGDATDHYMEVHRGDAIALQIYTNDLDGQAWVNDSNGGITSVYGDASVIDYTTVTDDRAGSYYSSNWPYTQAGWSGADHWYLEYMGGQGQDKWVAEDRLIITLNLTIREDAPLGPTYVGLQQAFVWWYNFWVNKTVFFEDRIDDDNNPGFRMELLVIPPAVAGDFDSDQDVDDVDIDLLCDAIRTGSTNFELFDISADGTTEGTDGVVDTLDLDYLVRFLVETAIGNGTEYGDFNLDGLVDTTDLTRLATNYGDDDWMWDDGNANRYIDPNIDNTDLTILATYFGFGGPDVVPEPMTLSLLAVGSAALIRRRK